MNFFWIIVGILTGLTKLSSARAASSSASPPSPPKVFCHYRMCMYDVEINTDDINTSLCTHVIFSEATLKDNGIQLCNTDKGLKETVSSMKRRGIKVVLKLGGWQDSDDIPNRSKYSILIENPSSRKEFLKNTELFLTKYGFEGLEIEWLYPVCWKADCSRGGFADKQNFATWIKEIKEGFKPRNLTLSAAVSQVPYFAERAYDPSALSRYLDWITVLTSYYHGAWNKVTGINSPLLPHGGTDFDTDSSVKYWLGKGLRKEQLVISVPFYGIVLKLKDEKKHGLGDEIVGAGHPGEWPYYQLCQFILNGEWKSWSDPNLRIGSYAYRGNNWASFDDEAMVERKGKYVLESKLHGVAVLYLQYDDFRKDCGSEAYPLLKALNRGLRRGQDHISKCLDDSITPFVINGELAKIEDYPYLVSIQTDEGSHFCGGVILDRNIVMTAAHCIEKKDPAEVRIVAGRTCQSQDMPSEQISASASFTLHPKYEYNKKETIILNDIALIKTTEKFKWRRYVQPARLIPHWDYKGGLNVSVAGWGKTEHEEISDHLLMANLVTAKDVVCSTQFKSAYSPESTFCIHTVGKDSCRGDSGGPVVNSQGDLIGLVSYGKRGCGRGPSVAVKTSWYLKWIEDQISLLDQQCRSPSPGSPVQPAQQHFVDTCGPNWKLWCSSSDCNCYTVLQSQLTWEEARDRCRRYGGSLASITDEDENNFIGQYLNYDQSRMWIGLNDIDKEGQFTWQNGEKPTNEEWNDFEPNDRGGDEDCVELMYSMKWNDENCSRKRKSICKVPLRRSDECPLGWAYYNTNCYQINTYRLIWKDALQNCRQKEADLTSILDGDENEFVYSLMEDVNDYNVWIGLDDESFKQRAWTDGSKVKYMMMNQTSYGSTSDCYLFNRAPKEWRAFKCGFKFPSVCKKRSTRI